MRIKAFSIVLFSSALPVVALAATPRFGSASDLGDFLNKVAYQIYLLILVVGTLYLLYGAFRYMTAAGDQKQVEEAKSTLLQAVIGLAVAIIAGGVPYIIKNFFGV